ncbi:hypothetical protein D3C83_188140 [compost metagenome]
MLRPDDDIVEAVTVYISGRGDRDAAPVVGRRAADAETIRAVKAGEIERGPKTACRSEHHVTLAG